MNSNPAKALLFGWSELAESDRAEFIEFHNREHLPERYAVPGFVRAARYVAVARNNAFLTVYEVDDLATLVSAPYLERLNNPTPWTQSMLPRIRKARRATVSLDLRRSEAKGGFLICAEWASVERGADSAPLRDVLASIADRPGIVSLSAGPVDLESSNIETAESRAVQRSAAEAGYLAIVEASMLESIEDVAAALKRPLGQWHEPRMGTYRLEVLLA